MEEELQNAYRALLMSEMVIGEEQVHDLADKTENEIEIIADQKNIMGVTIPNFKFEEIKTLQYNILSTSSRFDEAVKKAKSVIERIIEVAEIEGSVQMLGREIEKTKRRVNALEYIFIPRLVTTISYIERQLEEREREDFFRRKRIKALLEYHED